MQIKNSQGQIIFECDDDFRKANLDDIDLSGAMLENANLEGVVWCGTNLSRANLKAADFYWAILFTSNGRGEIGWLPSPSSVNDSDQLNLTLIATFKGKTARPPHDDETVYYRAWQNRGE